MASVGPSLPPHLQKRKRTPEDEGVSPESPPTKTARKNDDEVDLESDSDDDYGPSAPKSISAPTVGPAPPPSVGSGPPSIGPTLPPINTDEVALESDDENDASPAVGPQVPLNLAPKKRPMGPSLPPPNTEEIPLGDSASDSDTGPAPSAPPLPQTKRVQGPAPPPASLNERPPDSESESDDDDYGPSLPTSTSHTARHTAAAQAAAEAAAQPSAPKRDDWMLAPPSAASNRAPDPTKLKARKFASGPRANTSGSNGGEISSIWTETPEEKRKRLEAAVLGRDTAPNHSSTSNTSSSSSARPSGPKTADASHIASFTEATRGRSLYEEHQRSQGRHGSGRIQEEEDDPSARAFDREKDMKLGGRIGTAQRRELLNKAADFGGRFAKGKYL